MATLAKTKFTFEHAKPKIGSIARVAREDIFNDDFIAACLAEIEQRGVIVLPQVHMTDEEQLAFTDKLGDRVNFTRTVSGGDATAADVYEITLDKEKNAEPEYVLGTFFWHMDGLTIDLAPPKFSVLACKKTSPKGGQTQFASTTAAYAALSDEEKKDLEGVRVMHSVTAAVREVATPDELEPIKRSFTQEHPLVWKRASGPETLLIGYTADYVVGQSKAHGRALLVRLLEWAGQPDFVYSHEWNEGDLVIWDNCAALHRVIPYAEDSGRTMRRTSVAGTEKVS